jgi:hypothetical protein
MWHSPRIESRGIVRDMERLRPTDSIRAVVGERDAGGAMPGKRTLTEQLAVPALQAEPAPGPAAEAAGAAGPAVQRKAAASPSSEGHRPLPRLQLGGVAPDAAIQRRLAIQQGDRTDHESAADTQAAASHGVSGAGGRLPHLEAIQRSFGSHDVSGITAHTDGAATAGAAAMGAEAFATGNRVAFAGTPSLHTAAHEAAHVVQQRGGVQLKGGIGRAGDDYERNADAVADRVVAGAPAGDLLDRFAPAGGAPRSTGPVQRAVQVGGAHLPRVPDQAALAALGLDPTQIAQLMNMHAVRDRIYVFTDTAHMVAFLQGQPVPPPTERQVAPGDLDVGHKNANLMRFGQLYQPAPAQIPGHAPGGHGIPDQELPPAGPSHMWANTTDGAQPQHTLWNDRHTAPPLPTQIHTFGNPNDPSISTSQGIFNMGMRINPTTVNNTHLARNQATYAGLPTETGQVRGHPFALAQTQRSTDPTSAETFDTARLLETRESDGTAGGYSTFRYNRVENPAMRTMQPFNQVNVSSAPQVPTPMGIPATDIIHNSRRLPGGGYHQTAFDNQVDYRTQIGPSNQFHTRLDAHVTGNAFPYETVHRPDTDLNAPHRHSVPGYASPPPTPFISPGGHDALAEVNGVILAGRRMQNEPEMFHGDLYFIQEAAYDATTNQTTCKLIKAKTSFF